MHTEKQANEYRIKVIQYSYTPVISGKHNKTEVCSIKFYAGDLGVCQPSVLPSTHQVEMRERWNLLVEALVCTF